MTKTRKRCARSTSRVAELLVLLSLLDTSTAMHSTISRTTYRYDCPGEKSYTTHRRGQTSGSVQMTEMTSLQDQTIDWLHCSRHRTIPIATAICLRGGSIVTRRRQPASSKHANTKKKSLMGLRSDNPTTQTSQWSSADLRVFQSSSFFSVLALALVAFSPASALVAEIGSDRATSTLSIIAACAAVTEIFISPALGSLLDSVGRKPALAVALFCVATVNGIVSIHCSVVTICAAKFVGMLCLGSFFTATQVVISDISVSDPTRMSSMLGVQYALIGCAYFVGAISAGRLSELGLSITYGASAVVTFLTALLVSFGMRETLSPSQRIPFQENKDMIRKQLLQSPWSSCTRILFRHSNEVRILAILIMIQTLPMHWHETFQILARTEWNLNTKDFSSFVAVIGVINILANVVGSQMVMKFGIKYFTAVAILSSTLSPLGASLFSFRGLIIGAMVGFLASAQMLGVTAALYAEGAKSNVPQGELAGERSSFLALTKVIGPIWYSMLYVKGKKVFGTGYLPFFFNIACSLTAFVISQRYLSP